MEELKINANVLLAHGSGDRITSFEASKQFYEKLLIPEGCTKDSIFIDGGYHERTTYDLSYISKFHF